MSSRTSRQASGLVFVAVLLAALQAIAAVGDLKRARPPQWPKTVKDVFFDDARTKLAGSRPTGTDKAAVAGSPAVTGGGDAPASQSGTFTWSKLIDPETLESETKTIQKELSENVTTPAKFKGGGYKDGRLLLSMQAVVFAIIAEYDGEVRWQKQAAGMRDLIGRAGHNCKVGTDASYGEAKLRKDDLENLVRGNPPAMPANIDDKTNWKKVTDRPPLMSRIEKAQQQGITVWTANAADFKKNSEELLREAQVVAAISEVIQREGFEFADDETYLGFARQMRDQALEVANAVKSKNYEQARKAAGQIDKACSGCHEGYRS